MNACLHYMMGVNCSEWITNAGPQTNASYWVCGVVASLARYAKLIMVTHTH